jgi:hypothetical protein
MTAEAEVLKQDERGRVRVPAERREALLDEFEPGVSPNTDTFLMPLFMMRFFNSHLSTHHDPTPMTTNTRTMPTIQGSVDADSDLGSCATAELGIAFGVVLERVMHFDVLHQGAPKVHHKPAQGNALGKR